MKIFGLFKGLLINLQFFTIIPINRELPMDHKHMTYAVKTFPILGLLQGGVLTAALYMLTHYTPLSHLAIAFIIWLLTIVITGGLHLDGWMDASDAFFSYQDKEKRLEIMKDPRTGAFGVISLVVLLSGRFLFIYEITKMLMETSWILIIVIPFFSRSVMGYFLLMIPAVRKEGLGYFFQKSVQKRALFIYPLYILLFLILVVYLLPYALWQILILLFVTLAFLFIFHKKMIKWFGGMTGDLLGASVEGVEWVLWMSLWLLHYCVMA
ncbi:adenosylcobinamide-GDP ribazoletransferase [Heyndrickxia sporothermodurans]